MSDPPLADGRNEGDYLVALGALTHGDTGGPNGAETNRQSSEIAPPGTAQVCRAAVGP